MEAQAKMLADLIATVSSMNAKLDDLHPVVLELNQCRPGVERAADALRAEVGDLRARVIDTTHPAEPAAGTDMPPPFLLSADAPSSSSKPASASKQTSAAAATSGIDVCTRASPLDTTGCVTAPVTATSGETELATATARATTRPAPVPAIGEPLEVAPVATIYTVDVVSAACSTECAAQPATVSTMTAFLPWSSVWSPASPTTSATKGVVSTECLVLPSSGQSSVTTHTTELVSELPARCATPALVHDSCCIPDEAFNDKSADDVAFDDKSMGSDRFGGKSMSVPVALEAALLVGLRRWIVPKPDAPAHAMCSTKCSDINVLRPVPWPSFADDTVGFQFRPPWPSFKMASGGKFPSRTVLNLFQWCSSYDPRVTARAKQLLQFLGIHLQVSARSHVLSWFAGGQRSQYQWGAEHLLDEKDGAGNTNIFKGAGLVIGRGDVVLHDAIGWQSLSPDAYAKAWKRLRGPSDREYYLDADYCHDVQLQKHVQDTSNGFKEILAYSVYEEELGIQWLLAFVSDISQVALSEFSDESVDPFPQWAAASDLDGAAATIAPDVHVKDWKMPEIVTRLRQASETPIVCIWSCRFMSLLSGIEQEQGRSFQDLFLDPLTVWHGHLRYLASRIHVEYAEIIPNLTSRVATGHRHGSDLDHYWSVLTMNERLEQYRDSVKILGHKLTHEGATLVTSIIPILVQQTFEAIASSYVLSITKYLCAPWDPGGGILQVFGDCGLRASRMLRRGECHVPTVTWAKRWTGPTVSTHTKASQCYSSIPLYSLGYIRGPRTHAIDMDEPETEPENPDKGGGVSLSIPFASLSRSLEFLYQTIILYLN